MKESQHDCINHKIKNLNKKIGTSNFSNISTNSVIHFCENHDIYVYFQQWTKRKRYLKLLFQKT